MNSRMRLSDSLSAQLRSRWPVMVVVLAVSAILMGGGLILCTWTGASIVDLTRDPTSALGGPPYIGFLSQLGVLLWTASASVCLFSAYVLSKGRDPLQLKSFLLWSGILTVFLTLDDSI